ncbi:hypothetical protein NDU88_002670 [Pleurodeles waltl]|uniref:Uncharacterized protein n=1 Tax=Pleurodeles waltl TaxID=8319 RepID=A0AAV7M267_PLEWA|nr:hypothetical protein NDU88_002670 [Pleurodeles waltl]
MRPGGAGHPSLPPPPPVAKRRTHSSSLDPWHPSSKRCHLKTSSLPQEAAASPPGALPELRATPAPSRAGLRARPSRADPHSASSQPPPPRLRHRRPQAARGDLSAASRGQREDKGQQSESAAPLLHGAPLGNFFMAREPAVLPAGMPPFRGPHR